VLNATDEKNWSPPNAVYGNGSILALPGTQLQITAKVQLLRTSPPGDLFEKIQPLALPERLFCGSLRLPAPIISVSSALAHPLAFPVPCQNPCPPLKKAPPSSTASKNACRRVPAPARQLSTGLRDGRRHHHPSTDSSPASSNSHRPSTAYLVSMALLASAVGAFFPTWPLWSCRLRPAERDWHRASPFSGLRSKPVRPAVSPSCSACL